MIPPRKAEGEVDLKRPSGVWGELSQLSSLLCSGAAPPEAGWQQFGCSKAERTKSPHKAGFGRWRQDFIFFLPYRRRARGGGRSLQGGQPLKIIPRTVWRGTQSGTGSQAQSASPPPAARSPGRTFIYYTNRLYWCRSLYHPAQTPMYTRHIFRCNFLKCFIRTLRIYTENKPHPTSVTTTRVRMSIQSCMRHFKHNTVVKHKATEYGCILIRAESVLQCYLNQSRWVLRRKVLYWLPFC